MQTSLAGPPSAPLLPRADRVGIAASLVCLVHCTAPPLLALTAPALGAAWFSGEWLGWAGIAVAAAVAAVTLPAGRTRHGRHAPFALGAGGLLLLVLGELASGRSGAAGASLSLVGASGLIAAHLQNRRLARACQVCGHPECAAPVGGEPSAT